jgi:hypothetical protein
MSKVILLNSYLDPLPDINNNANTIRIFSQNVANGQIVGVEEGLNPWEEGLTYYQIDYMIVAFGEMMRREIKNNPDVVFNNFFQKFMQWVSEFKRIIIDVRSSPTATAKPPIQMKSNIPKKYSCNNIDIHRFSDVISDELRSIISSNKINSKVYVPKALWQTLIPTPSQDFLRIYTTYCNCCQTEINALFSDVIIKTQDAWNEYISSLHQPVISQSLDQVHTKFQNNIAIIKNQISNGDYHVRYDIIETLLKKSVGLMDDLISSTNTELDIVKNTTNIDDYYEKISFENSDIDSALVIPLDKYDLVSQEQIKNDIDTSIQKNAKMATSNVIANTYNIPTSIQNITDIGSLTFGLLDTLEKSSNITSPSQELLDLTMTKIYRNRQDKPVAKYLNDQEIKSLKKSQLDDQNAYLYRISEIPDINIGGIDIARNRLKAYKDAYPNITYSQTGGSKYRIKNRLVQRISVVQNGGRKIDIDEITESNEQSRKDLKNIKKQINTIDKIYDKQNMEYFRNENFLNINNLQQRNDFLIEMMNIIIIYNFLLGEKTETHRNFFIQLEKKIKIFKDNLTDIWNIMKSRIDTKFDNDEIMNTILANGTITINDIKTLFSSVGLAPTAAYIKSDEMINRSEILKIMSALAEKYGISNIALISNELYNLYNINPINNNENKTINELYSDLNSFYSSLITISNNLSTEYQSINTNAEDLINLKKFIGDILETNLITINIYIKELVSILQNFGIKTTSIQNIRQEMQKSKARINNFEIYMKESLNRLISKKDVLKSNHDDIAKIDNGIVLMNHNVGNSEISDFYKNYVSEYADKIYNVSKNTIKYYSYTKDLRYVKKRKNLLEKNMLEFDIIATGVYQDYYKNVLDSKLRKMYMLPQNLRSNNFDGLIAQILDYIDNYVGLTDKSIPSMIPLYQNINNKVGQSYLVSAILNNFSASKPSDIMHMVRILFGKNSNNKWVFKSDNGINKHDQYSLIDHLTNRFKRYISYMQIYRDTSNPTRMYSSTDDLFEIETYINETQDRYLKSRNGDDLNNLIQTIKNAKDLSPDIEKLGSDMEKFLSNHAITLGLKIDNLTDMNKYQNEIIQEFNNMTFNILDLFNEKIMKIYQMMNALALINNTYNPNYNKIQQAQQEVSKLSTNSPQLKLLNSYNNLGKISNILTPNKTKNGIRTDYTKFMVNFNFAKNIHFFMNSYFLGNDRPFMLQYGKKDWFITIRDEYLNFDEMATPLARLMRSMSENGINILNNANIIDFTSILTSIDRALYTNSFKYGTDGIIFVFNNRKYNSFYSEYKKRTNHVIGDVKSGGLELDTYVPSYDDDNIEIKENKLTYYISKNNIEKYNIRIHPRKIDFKINANSKITQSHIDSVIKLLNTGRYLINFMDKLGDVIPKIQTINLETPATWGSPVNSIDQLYRSRAQKKNILVEVLLVIEHINNILLSNTNNYYLRDVLLGLSDDSKNSNRDAIMNARIQVESADPINADFNRTVDKIWIFTRKIVNAWYTIFGHMLSYFILNQEVINIINFIKLININSDELLSLSSYRYSVDKLSDYYYDTIKELNISQKTLSENREKYPININPVNGNSNKYIIPNNIKQIVDFDEFYSNISSKSVNIYAILALIKNDKTNEIRKPLEEIESKTNEIVAFIESVDPFLDESYVINKIISVHTDDYMSHEINLVITNFLNSILSEFKTALFGIGLETIYNKIKANSTSLINNFLFNYLVNDIGDEENDPTIVPNRIIDITSPNFINYNSLHIKLNHDRKKVYWTMPEKTLSQYKFLYNAMMHEQTEQSVNIFFRLLVTDIYGIVFSEILNEIYNLMAEINDQISITEVQDFYDFRLAFAKYFRTKKIKNIYPTTKKPHNIIKRPISNNNADYVKAILFTNEKYSGQRIVIMNIYDVFKNVTTYIKSNLGKIYQNENYVHQEIINMETILTNGLQNNKMEILEKNIKLHDVINTITLVMFNEHYKSFAFVDNNKILDYVSQVVDNYETIWRMINQKVRDITSKNNLYALTISQINNYIAFKSSVNKLINNKSVINNFYKRMSFGIIEYYYDILNSIIYCLETKFYDSMSEVEQYLYQYHYVSLKRCHMLFKWLRHEYLPSKQEYDELNRSNKNFKSILEYKIETLKTNRDANIIFIEFQGIRKYLDDYSATIMDKVQLHLRINDFVIDEKNKELVTNAKGRNYKFLYDDDPDSKEYKIKWESGNLAFTNPDDDNILKVNFDLLDKIFEYDNPAATTMVPYNILYSDVYSKMEPTFIGIDFQRIYNTKIYPDSDVISNYMSIAPNIITGKGTVIMTYGYSGVGKSASLFGRDANPIKKTPPSNGILQATLGYFGSNVEIRFRVFEIYGMGTQYNYYWNPENFGSLECFPEITQCVIHHVIDNKNPSTLRSVDRIVFNNKHDIFSYIMDLKNPRDGTKFSINAKDINNLAGTEDSGNINQYFDLVGNNYKMRNSTYVEITNPDQYYNFNSFVSSVDRARIKGLKMKKLLEHVVKQVKPTINNPDSSRSILVYDFEINLDTKSQNPIFVPFLIYDLPGKEDVYRTYVNTGTRKDDEKSFHNIDNDIAKERKSTYVTNPLLIPIFDDNADLVRDILVELSNDPSSVNAYNGVKFNDDFEEKIVNDIVQYQITTFAYPDTNNNDYTDPGASYTVGSLFQDPANIKKFMHLFDENNIKPELYDINTLQDILVIQLGIIGPNASYETGTVTKEIIASELRVLLCVIVMAFLIKFQLFDLLVEIINVIVNGKTGSNNDKNGGWSRTKIYAFYEAYYINENVVGLLQYLINNVLKKKSTIEEQDTINENINDTINKNYKTANRYRAVLNLFNIDPNSPIDNDYGFKVNTDLLVVNSSDNKSVVLKEMEINEFKNKNQVDDDGTFAISDTNRTEVFNKMADVISFENKGKYDSNKIFRSGDTSFVCSVPADPNGQNIINPKKAIVLTDPEYLAETNRPLLQDFIEPYEQKISFYYVFYVVSNNQMKLKAEEQIKLLNNSMPFIKEMDPASKKSKCSS